LLEAYSVTVLLLHGRYYDQDFEKLKLWLLLSLVEAKCG